MATIAMSKKSLFHGLSNHIGIKQQKIHDLMKDQEIELEFCSSQNQIVDCLCI